MRQNAVITLLTIVLLAILTALSPRAWHHINFYMLTGHFFPIHKVEALNDPIAVKGWTTNGMLLLDGRTIQLNGIHALPGRSSALQEITKRGVEIAADGRVYGLARIWHGCGNDPVREHIAGWMFLMR